MTRTGLGLALSLLCAWSGPTRAGGDECEACCRAGGLSGCRSSLRLYGDGAVAVREGGGWRVLGLWVLDCDGTARFEPGATVVVGRMPVAGELLLGGTPPLALHCFDQACSFPESACVRDEAEGRRRLVDCRDGAPMPAVQLARRGPTPPGSESVIAVVDGEPLVVTPKPGAMPASGGGRAPSTGPAPCCGGGLVDAVTAGDVDPPRRAVVTRGTSVDRPSAGDARPGVRASPGRSDLVIEVPAPPLAIPCGVDEALATESRRRDVAGNEAVVRGDLQRAIDEYRAALTLDPCNAYAWADLGAASLQAGRPSEAALSLAQAVEIQPRHYAALTNLGLAYEALGQDVLAIDSFRRALALRPHHGPAEQGLERLGGR